jgi:hypothetical protein
MKRSPLKRGKPLPRPKETKLSRTPVRKVNKQQGVKRALWWLKDLFGYQDAARREKEAAARERAFGAKADWVRKQRCALEDNYGYECRYHWDWNGSVTDPAHVTHSRGAGGDSSAIIPLCRHHHEQQHTIGVRTFEERYAVNLESLAASFEQRYQEEREK